VPQPLVFGARPMQLERAIHLFAGQLRRRYSEEICSDAKKFKNRVVSIIRRELPPFPGRPTEEAINRAIELHKQGQLWKEIYPQCISYHFELEPPARRQAESNLRAAIRSRRNAARRRRKRQRQLNAESIAS